MDVERSGAELHPSHFRVSAVVKTTDMKYGRGFYELLKSVERQAINSELKGQLLRSLIIYRYF